MSERDSNAYRRCRLLFAAWIVLSIPLLILPGLRAMAAPTAGLVGVVRDEAGNPLGNVRVRASAGPSAGALTFTSADGTYQLAGLEPGSYTFTATRDGLTDARSDLSLFTGETARLDFTLRVETRAGGSLEGFITRADTGAPVPGAQVNAVSGLSNAVELTDAAGFYRFTLLPAGNYRVSVSRTGFQPAQRFSQVVRNGRTTRSDFRLLLQPAELGQISGRVTNTAGQPLPSARVTLLDGASAGLSILADNQGRYTLRNIIPDAYSIAFTLPGFQTAVVQNFPVNPGARVTLDQVLSPTTAIGNSSVQGTVFSNQPLQGARVEVTAGPVTGLFDVTDALGRYRIGNLPSGTYTFTVTASGFVDNIQVLTLNENQDLLFDFVMVFNNDPQRGTVTGTVTDGSGNAVPGVNVRVTAGPVTGMSTTTAGDGRYSIRSLPQGTYALTFTAPGFQEHTETNIPTVNDVTTVVNVQLTPGQTGGTLAGTVRDTNLNLLSGVTVQVLQGSVVVATGATGANGQYQIAGVLPGTYSLRFSQTGFVSATVTGIQVLSGQTTTVDAILTPDGGGGGTGTVSGVIQDDSGNAVIGATVELSGPSGTRTVRAGSDGRFTFVNVPAGTGYRVRATAPGFDTGEQTGITVAAGQTVQVTLVLVAQANQGGIAGLVRGSNGVLVAGATVALVQRGRVLGTRVTDAGGRFSFLGAAPGDYVLSVRAPRFRPLQRPVRLVGGVLQLTLTVIPL